MWLALNETTKNALEELEKGSDRTIAVVAGAIVDSHLTDLIKRELAREDTKHSSQVLSDLFQPDGPLGNFGAKIAVAYLMGYFSPAAHDDLQNFKNIRNQFAHYSEHNSFESQKIRDRCNNFKIIKDHIVQSILKLDVDGTNQIVDGVSGAGKVQLHLAKCDDALVTAKARFINTAKLFVAALELAPVLSFKPIL